MGLMALAAALALRAAAAPSPALRVSVVDQDGKPVRDAVVYSVDAAATAAQAPADAVMDQVALDLKPRVLVVRAGARVRFPNNDQVRHQLYSFSKAKRFELPLYKGQDAPPVVFDTPGVVKIGCNIHDWMLGYVVVVPNDDFAVTDASGSARLPRPASGSVTVWSERLRGEAPKAPVPAAGVGELVLRIKARAPVKAAAHHALAPY